MHRSKTIFKISTKKRGGEGLEVSITKRSSAVAPAATYLPLLNWRARKPPVFNPLHEVGYYTLHSRRVGVTKYPSLVYTLTSKVGVLLEESGVGV
eukprot:763456-Hanusia_phi.AAC.11